MKISRKWPVGVQLVGAAAVLAGVYGLLGLWWALALVGVAAVAVGTLAELKGGR